ncbi:MAG: (Fe-S)-binding protein, partial [Candidatus Coatesbacteria bacterium]
CHLAAGMGVREAPRALLRWRGEVVELEPPGGVSCCGGAGSYGLDRDDIFASIGGERAEAIAAAGATICAAGCPACVFYLNEALRRSGIPASARHTAEVLAGE